MKRTFLLDDWPSYVRIIEGWPLAGGQGGCGAHLKSGVPTHEGIPMTELLSFSHWSDPLCIWAFVAQDKLERLLSEFGERLDVDYRVVPVFGSIPWRFAQGAWANAGVAGRAATTAEIARTHGHPEVSGACWKHDCPASSWSCGAAIKAVCTLEASGELEPGSGGRYQKELRRRFFVDNVNIARRSAQLELAESLGISTAALQAPLDDGRALSWLWEDYTEAERLKLQGSPTYVFDSGRAMLYGNFNFGVLHATVEQLLGGLHPEGSRC